MSAKFILLEQFHVDVEIEENLLDDKMLAELAQHEIRKSLQDALIQIQAVMAKPNRKKIRLKLTK